MRYELGLIGAGNMAEAIARGVLRAGVFTAGQMIASDMSEARRELFERELGVRATADNADAAREAKIILLCVKPYQIKQVLAEIGSSTQPETLVISIAAGVSAAKIQMGLGQGHRWRIVRSMPNTPVLVGEGMVAIARGRHASESDLGSARRIFEAAAAVIEVEEDKMDAVTAVSGSGPAYFFYLVEQMIAAGQEMGLTPEQAATLASRTAAGAARMLLNTAEPPEELRRRVTTPGGTTHAAIETMELRGVGQSIIAALHRAAERSREMGE